ncbi:NAC domain-containing protein [Canna indica]|uniref:NAC domain-containing protein n=1 Tax=Canna indica TaxID=4628 RepID=A0AAQ3KD02_9LILI|nr:NAC domain-containing protein [Canna indica]
MVVREMAVLSAESLPLGFRFRPTDVELVNHYLKGKISGRIKSEVEVIPEIDVCKYEPWDLPDKSIIKSNDSEWFFFAPRDRKYSNGNRSNRATKAGYWKSTGKDRMIKYKIPGSAIIGSKKTLVFHQGRAPKGARTNWIIHEYRTADSELESGEQGGFVLCRLFKKPGKAEERTQISDIDELERTTEGDDMEDSSGLSSATTMLSPAGTQHGVDVIAEPVTPFEQKPPALVLQENLQPLPQTSDVKSSNVSDLLADKVDFAGTYTSNQEKNHCNGTVVSDAADHEIDETTEVDFSLSLEDFTKFLPKCDDLACDDFNNISSELPNMGNTFYGGLNQNFLPELKQSDYADDDSIKEFLESVLCDPEECSPEVSNTSNGITTMPDGEVQNGVIPDYSPWHLHSIKDKEGIGFSGEVYIPPICSSSMPHGINQFSVFPNQNFGQNVPLMDENPLHQESAKMDNFDSPRIQIRSHKNLSDSTRSTEQGLATRRIRLQKFVHKGSVPRTDHVLSSTNGDILKLVVSEVRQITEHQFCGEKSSKVFASSNAKDIPSHAPTVSSAIKSSPEVCAESRSKRLGLRTRWARKDDGSTRGQSLDSVATSAGSHAPIKTILIISALLLFAFLGLSWCLRS